jgi:hypothetical protein
MINIFIYSFIVYGICNILIWGSNFNWWRAFLSKLGQGDYSLHKLFTCFMCLPTWIGPLVSFTSIHFGNGSLSITNNMGFEHIWVVLLLDGVFASGVVWVINTIQEYFENK